MIKNINAINIDNNTIIESEIVIVGSGIAASSFLEFYNKENVKIVILEKGDLDLNFLSNNRNTSENKINNKILNLGNINFNKEGILETVGGNSSRWGGRFMSLDKEDFEKRPWIEEDQDWGFNFSEYEKELNKISKNYSVKGISKLDPIFQLNKKYLKKNKKIDNKIFSIKFINFFNRIKNISNKKNISLIYNINVDSLSCGENSRISEIRASNELGQNICIRSNNFILASNVFGNIELLLKSSRDNNSIYNFNNIVGRYAMNHSSGNIGNIPKKYFEKFSNLYFGSNFFKSSYRYGIKSSPLRQKEKKITNNLLLFLPKYSFNNSQRGKNFLKWFSYKFDSNNIESIDVNAYQEIIPRFNNLICVNSISNKIEVKISSSTLENDSLATLYKDFLSSLNINNKAISEIISQSKLKNIIEDSYHYSGGTRMGIEKDISVVNKYCQHHLINNLFILGTSVFPKSGHANPVGTLLVLSSRLARYMITKKL